MIDLKDGVAAYRTDDGELRLDQSVQATRGQGADLGLIAGALLGGMLAAPFTGGLSAAAAAGAVGAGAAGGAVGGAFAGADDATDFKRRYGISDEFVDQVGKLIQPGDSAVFVLARTVDPDVVAEKFRGYGGTILRSNLSIPEAARAQAQSSRLSGHPSGVFVHALVKTERLRPLAVQTKFILTRTRRAR